ncbi:hypothetical protein [Chromatium okenii]|uniref:OmpA-like domain-containing protein n=1 Tax=Chromatium okenii TaxID=61644 RepID=A0A2S7XPF9_9GAMM|nr:hypothetical protein [Chromatium okenii]PQJ95615.1 hypothetical protein CXB77_16055 [Chromatium okenii]
MERKRGLVTGRELQTPAEKPAAAPARKTTAAPAPRHKADAPAPAPRPRKVVDPDENVRPAAPKPRRQPCRMFTRPAPATGGYCRWRVDLFRLQLGATDQRCDDRAGKLGKALTSPQFEGISWLVEGTPMMPVLLPTIRNCQNSGRSSARYLVESTGIAPERLHAVGKGESEPFDRDNPRASVNRRVRLRPSGG